MWICRTRGHGMRSPGKIVVVWVFVLALLAAAVGCALPSRRDTKKVTVGQNVETFLGQFGLKTKGDPIRFMVKVPESWVVPMGAYPEGLYWGLANEVSKDAGLDLAPLKGKTVEVWRYALADALPGRGTQSQYRYPSDAIVLVRGDTIVGAWLAFNLHTIGPSVKMRYVEDITGLTFEQWVERESYFAAPGENADLVSLGPIEVLNSFFEAINKGDKTRAAACLSPRAMLYSLTMNLSREERLYNSGFSPRNSLVENIRRAKLLSYKLTEPDTPGVEIREVGDRTRVAVTAYLEITWQDDLFNTPSGRAARFAGLEKYPNGWKLTGLGTGP